ncbi:hypothetical protein [Burkholderia vietnamiensis]|uniref:hypothetical protein n=1 Tax=Burkholderia vietnamiensis TaxID=60552 RepID=UPI001D141436|nr:hypothetical protein [Burkholderia vietnamiensis]UEC05500.1 hypothetical protein LK462_35420 [Burkholderia vietnamiensis]
MNTNTVARRSRAVEYAVAGCVAAGLLFGVLHFARRISAVHERVEAIAAGCRPVVDAQANRLAQQHAGLTWAVNDIRVLGDIDPDQPDQNTCAVSMTFNVGGQPDKERWEVGAQAGSFALGSAKLAGVETNQ